MNISTVMQGGSYGLVGLIVWLVLTGRLVTRGAVKDVRADRDMWRKAYEQAEESRRLSAHHVAEFVEINRTTSKALEAIPALAQSEREGDTGGLVA